MCAQEDAGAGLAHRARHRGRHRLGHLHRHRHGHRRGEVRHHLRAQHSGRGLPYPSHRAGRPPWRRTGARALTGAGRSRLLLYRPLLCGAGVDDPHRRLRLHLHLRHHGRAGRLDHRLGPDPRIRLLEHGGLGRLRRAPGRPDGLARHSSIAAVDLSGVSPIRITRPAGEHPLRLRLALRLQHPGLPGGDPAYGGAGPRHPRVGCDQ